MKSKVSSRIGHRWWLFAFLLKIAKMLLVGCQSSWQQSIPEGDIIYMPFSSDLGFVQLGGENNHTIEIARRLAKPVFSTDGKIIYGLSGAAYAGLENGHPAYWDLDRGRYKICEKNLPFYFQIQGTGNYEENPYEVYLLGTWEIISMDLSQCKLVKTVVDYSDHPGDYSLAGFSYSPVTNQLVYGLVVDLYLTNPSAREYRIMQMDIETNEQVHLADGINPVLSPDGTQIAYLGTDGLYVMLSNGSAIKKLIDQPLFDLWASGSPWFSTPIPRWSLDGEWLIYHRCNTERICSFQDAKIYKIHTDYGSGEQEILESGEYPNWRP